MPLLLLNGLGAALELWRPLRAALGERRTIAFDAPGVGGSPVGDPPTSMTGQAQVAVGVLDALGVEQADVLGFSFGGMVAQEVARMAPGRVRRLVLAATCCGWGSVPGSPLPLIAARIAEHRIEGRRSPSWRGYLGQLTAAAGWSSLPWLSRLAVPTLVLAGTADLLVPAANARLLASLLGSARAHLVPGGDHLFLFERTDEVAPVIAAFLAG